MNALKFVKKNRVLISSFFFFLEFVFVLILTVAQLNFFYLEIFIRNSLIAIVALGLSYGIFIGNIKLFLLFAFLRAIGFNIVSGFQFDFGTFIIFGAAIAIIVLIMTKNGMPNSRMEKITPILIILILILSRIFIGHWSFWELLFISLFEWFALWLFILWIKDEIEIYKHLLDSGVITEEEFTAKKKEKFKW